MRYPSLKYTCKVIHKNTYYVYVYTRLCSKSQTNNILFIRNKIEKQQMKRTTMLINEEKADTFIFLFRFTTLLLIVFTFAFTFCFLPSSSRSGLNDRIPNYNAITKSTNSMSTTTIKCVPFISFSFYTVNFHFPTHC